MAAPTGIVPEEWMYPKHKKDVLHLLMELPVPPEEKYDTYHQWCILVGTRPTKIEIELLRNS